MTLPKPQPKERVWFLHPCPICGVDAGWRGTSVHPGGTEYVITCPTETCTNLSPEQRWDDV